MQCWGCEAVIGRVTLAEFLVQGGPVMFVLLLLSVAAMAIVLLKTYRLPDGKAKVQSTDVLFIADTQYPLSSMDMFWTDLEVMRPDGSPFEGSESIEQHLGRQWRRFSYHRNGVWNTAGNPLLHHFALMESRWTGKALQ